MLIPKIIKGKNTAHKDAFKIENLTLKGKDRSKIIKLLSKIREKENVAEKLKKSSYNTQTILAIKITFKYQDQSVEERTFTLPYHAIFHENNQAFDDLLQEAIEQKLLKNVLNEEMIIKHSDSREETHTILTCAILREDCMMIRKVLKVSKEHGILGDILNKTVTIKHAEGQEVIYTPFDYAKLCGNSEAVDEILKVAREENIPEGILKGKSAIDEQTLLPTAVKETAIKELKDSYTLADIEEAIEECKESLEVKEQEDIPHTETDPQLYKDISKNSEDFQPIFESSEKAQNSSIETATLEPNATDSPSSTEIESCFDSGSGKGNSADEKSSKRAIQPILAGVVGAVLLVSGVALYIMKMPVVAVVVGIVGLACAGFALYNSFKPNTKLEKVEDIERHVIAQSPSNPG